MERKDIPSIDQLFDSPCNDYISIFVQFALISRPEPPLTRKTLFVRLVVIQITLGDILPPHTDFALPSLADMLSLTIEDSDFDALTGSNGPGLTFGGGKGVRCHLMGCLSHGIRFQDRSIESLFERMECGFSEGRGTTSDETDIRLWQWGRVMQEDLMDGGN